MNKSDELAKTRLPGSAEAEQDTLVPYNATTEPRLLSLASLTALPADRHPAKVYLKRLAPGSADDHAKRPANSR